MLHRFLPSLGLAALLFVACADPPTPSESPPSEVTTSAERRPEDAGPSEEAVAEPRPEVVAEPSPDGCQTACPRITRLEGEGTVAAPVYPNGTSAPQGAVEAKARFRETWVLEGEHLDRLTRLTLVSAAEPTKIFELSWEGQASMTKRTVRVPKTLVAGLFLLIGFVGTTPVALGQTFVLQGEGLDADTLAYLQRLKSRLTVDPATNAVRLEAPALELKAGAASVSLDAATRTLLCQGANVQITNGDAAKDTYTANGFGNLLLGYNKNVAPPLSPLERSGSHNLVIGDLHSFSATGGLVAGYNNHISSSSTSVLGGQSNRASSSYASVAGGQSNTASGIYASVAGGQSNTSKGTHSSVAGGEGNTSYANHSSIAGGQNNKTGLESDASKGAHASVAGGETNKIYANYGAVLGGTANSIGVLHLPEAGKHATIVGGKMNKAHGNHSSILGGESNTTGKSGSSMGEGEGSSVAGGKNNTLEGKLSFVCGLDSSANPRTVTTSGTVTCP